MVTGAAFKADHLQDRGARKMADLAAKEFSFTPGAKNSLGRAKQRVGENLKSRSISMWWAHTDPNRGPAD
jgi:hypothetical protein